MHFTFLTSRFSASVGPLEQPPVAWEGEDLALPGPHGASQPNGVESRHGLARRSARWRRRARDRARPCSKFTRPVTYRVSVRGVAARNLVSPSPSAATPADGRVLFYQGAAVAATI